MLRRKQNDGTTVLEGGLTLVDMINMFHPVNSIIMTTDNVNPSTRFAGTTWVAWGAGRAVVGVGSNGVNTYTSEQTFGVDSVTLSAAQSGVNAHTHSHTLAAPSHTHTATTTTDGDHIHQPGSPLDSNWGYLAFLQGGSVSRSAMTASGTRFAFSVTTQADIDYANATDTAGDHNHTLTTSGPSATALTGALGAVASATAAIAHENRQASIATYLWKRTA